MICVQIQLFVLLRTNIEYVNSENTKLLTSININYALLALTYVVLVLKMVVFELLMSI